MGEDEEPQEFKIDHFVYGSHEGYRIKANSSGVDVKMFEDAFMGYFIPVSQTDVKYVSDVRSILPVGEKYICLSHIVPGPRDEYQRKTMSCHSAVIPRRLLAQGKVTYEDVDLAMKQFGSDRGEAVGQIDKLTVQEGWGIDMAELKTVIKKDDLEKLMDHYKKERDTKVFLKYNGSDPTTRVKTAYLLSMFIDIGMNIIPLAIFTDVPYPDAKKLFNLVISRGMISIKPGQGWKMLPISAPPPESVVTRGGGDPMKNIYG
ncbi:MAG: hypothetical protein ACMUIE_09225 [Thermoplasmatota archaeon]